MLIQHIPHRVRATLPGLPMKGPWAINWRAVIQAHKVVWPCMQNSVHEGRMTAIRCLIIFVGVSGRDKAPVLAQLRLQPDMRIDRLGGGVLFDLSSPEAFVLEKIWRGCSQATSHPTQDTNHPKVEPEFLAPALEIIIAHLERTAYRTAGRSLALAGAACPALGRFHALLTRARRHKTLLLRTGE